MITYSPSHLTLESTVRCVPTLHCLSLRLFLGNDGGGGGF